MAEASARRGKSYNDIVSQADRILSRMGDSQGRITYGELGRYAVVQRAAQRYLRNIENTRQYGATTQQLRETFRNGGRSPEESRATAQRINELREQRNSRRYPRSVYARRNNRR